MVKRLPKTTRKQLKELFTFASNNKVILSSKIYPHESKRIAKLWEEFANYINCKGYGPQKTSKQWRHVFSEWKTNIRRKNRKIQSNLCKKRLTELEEQLLSLISNIHSGDNFIQSSLISDKKIEMASPTSNIAIDTSYEFCMPEDEIKIEVTSPIVQDEMESEEPLVIKNPIMRKRKYKNVRSKKRRYTNSLLKSACKAYFKGQEINLLSQELQMKVFKNLNEGIYNVAAELKKQNSISLLKLKLEYFKVHNTYKGFDKFIE